MPEEHTKSIKDRNGTEATIGAMVFVLPQAGLRKGGKAWLRAIPGKGHPLGVRARCDDAPQHEEINMNNHTFSAWCKPSEFEVLALNHPHTPQEKGETHE